MYCINECLDFESRKKKKKNQHIKLIITKIKYSGFQEVPVVFRRKTQRLMIMDELWNFLFYIDMQEDNRVLMGKVKPCLGRFTRFSLTVLCKCANNRTKKKHSANVNTPV